MLFFLCIVTRLLYTSLFGVPKRRAFQRDRNVRLNSCSMLLVCSDAGRHLAPAVHTATRGEKQQVPPTAASYSDWLTTHTHTLHSRMTPVTHTHPFQKKTNDEKTKERKETPKQTNKNMSNHEFGRSIIANIQEANYKNCQYHFPLNSHNKKQPLLIWGEKHASLKR